MTTTRIEWTDHSLGAARMGLFGCTHAGPGCAHCWAESMASRFESEHGYPPGIVANGRWTGRVETDASKIGPAFESLPKRKRCRVFAPSSGDLFHPDVPYIFAERVLREFADRPHLTGQILTKRPGRMARLARNRSEWPSNVWAGMSASTQADLDRGVPDLLRVPAAVRFLSLEPLLERVDLLANDPLALGVPLADGTRWGGSKGIIDWIIVGAESGPNRRPCRLEWVRSVVEQCRDAGVPCFCKQIHDSRGNVIHAGDPEWPAWAPQEFPRTDDNPPPRASREGGGGR